MLDHTNTPANVRGTPLLPGEGRGLDAGGPAPDQGAPLGILRNLRPRAPQADFQARWDFDRQYTSLEEVERATRRYAKLRRFALQSAAVAAVGDKRLRDCLRVNHQPVIEIVHSPATHSAFYRGLVTCGSVWMCPICAAKVSERRRAELGQGITKWRDLGGAVWLLTLTFAHTVYDSLAELNKRLAAALRRFQSGKHYAAVREDFGFRGHVRALEVTHGANGWHPHVHMLVFLEGADTHARRDELRERLFHRWLLACERSGLGLPNERHGVRVDGHDKAGEYITKWGLESELTKHVSKQGRGSSRTPMGILADFLEGGDMGDAELFASYARAMKGSRQLCWSRGLRQLLELGDEMTDEQLADADEAQAGDNVLRGLGLAEWRLVVKWDVRGQLILVAASGDAALVSDYLDDLRELENV